MNEFLNTIIISIHLRTILYYTINTISIFFIQWNLVMFPLQSVGRIGYDMPLVVVWT